MHSNGATKWHKKGLCSTLHRTIKVQAELKKEERKKVTSLSPVRLSATPWTAAHQAPQSMEFSGLESGVYWSGVPLREITSWEGRHWRKHTHEKGHVMLISAFTSELLWEHSINCEVTKPWVLISLPHLYLLNDFEQVTHPLWASASSCENEGTNTH